jgi:neutral ceramidase
VPVTPGARLALALVVVLGLGAGAADASCDACVTAGAGRTAFALPPGTSLAGYGGFSRRLLLPDVLDLYPHAFWLKPSVGQRDPLAARALVLERDGLRVTWLTVDLVAVDRAFTEAVAARLGAAAGTLIVSASHTHSGPGGYIDSTMAGFLTMDRLDGLVRETLVQSAVAAVRTAETARGPARVGVATVEGPPVITSRLGKPLDRDVIVVAVRRPEGAPVAVVWNFGIHATMLSGSNRELSADVIGATSQAIEKELAVPALFVAGALGDVSPARHGAASLPGVGADLAAAVLGGWRTARPLARTNLATRATTVSLPAPRLSLRNCLGRWMPRALTVSLGRMFPREAQLTAVALGDVAWVVVPGELQTELGRQVKRAGRGLFGEVFVAGVSNDYLGYFVTAEDYDRPAYVTCASVYAADTGERLTERAVDLLYELRGRTRPRRAP